MLTHILYTTKHFAHLLAPFLPKNFIRVSPFLVGGSTFRPFFRKNTNLVWAWFYVHVVHLTFLGLQLDSFLWWDREGKIGESATQWILDSSRIFLQERARTKLLVSAAGGGFLIGGLFRNEQKICFSLHFDMCFIFFTYILNFIKFFISTSF